MNETIIVCGGASAFVLLPTTGVSSAMRNWAHEYVKTRTPMPLMYAVRVSGEDRQEALDTAQMIAQVMWGYELELLLKGDDPTLSDYIASGLVTPGWEVSDQYLGFSREIGGRRVLVLNLVRAYDRIEYPMDLCFTPNTNAAHMFRHHNALVRERVLTSEERERNEQHLAILHDLIDRIEAEEAGGMDAGELPF